VCVPDWLKQKCTTLSQNNFTKQKGLEARLKWKNACLARESQNSTLSMNSQKKKKKQQKINAYNTETAI
jgi:hypothetical protein